MSAYPEHEKMKEISDQSQAIGAFLEWLQGERGASLLVLDDCPSGSLAETWGDRRSDYRPAPHTEKLLAEYFEIDLNKIENEKRAMLDEFAAMTDAA